MPAYMNGKTGAWYVQCYYSDIDGNRKHKVKRGFATKGEALAWETEFLACADGSMSMPFEAFVKRYSEDVKPRLKLNTWLTKEHIIRTKIVPFFGPKRMCDISPKDVVDWQNKMVGSYDDEGKPYSGTYLRTINNQLSAIFNHAVKYYGLGKSPAAPTIKIGERKGSEMRFWTKEQYLMFSEEIMDKPASFYAFEILYWCGLRVGELLALEPDDIDLEKMPHPHHQKLPANQEKGCHHVAQDAQIEKGRSYAGVPRRRARRSPRINPRGAARLPHLLLYQKLPAPRDEARMRRVRSRADSDSRPPPQPRIASHRDGLQPACHSGPAGTRDLRDDASLRPPLPQQAVGYGGGARPGKEALMSRPIVDYKGRRRSKTIAFRVSPEEDEVINALVAASGMTKQDYITSRLECRDINVSPNVRVYRMLRDQMRSVYVELRRLRSADGIDERLIELMQVLTRVFIDLGADELGAVGDDVAQQDAAVLRMARD